MNKLIATLFLTGALSGMASAANVTLGTFTFDDQKFGNTLTESDGGAFRNSNWLNVVNSNPGNPGALTGANFDTGIANMILGSGNVDYTIGYSSPIVNGAGNDLGLVVGYSYLGDTFHVAVSTNGTTFTAFQNFAGSTAVDTGVNKSYFYAGAGPYGTNLAVISIDLSSFGIAMGNSVSAIRIEGIAGEQDDVIRVAGFSSATTAAPEPSFFGLCGAGLAGLAYWRKRRA